MDWWHQDPDPWSRNWEGEEIEEDETVPATPIFRVSNKTLSITYGLVVKAYS